MVERLRWPAQGTRRRFTCCARRWMPCSPAPARWRSSATARQSVTRAAEQVVATKGGPPNRFGSSSAAAGRFLLTSRCSRTPRSRIVLYAPRGHAVPDAAAHLHHAPGRPTAGRPGKGPGLTAARPRRLRSRCCQGRPRPVQRAAHRGPRGRTSSSTISPVLVGALELGITAGPRLDTPLACRLDSGRWNTTENLLLRYAPRPGQLSALARARSLCVRRRRRRSCR